MKRAKRYNIIIYTSLLLAIILLALGGRDYLKDKSNGSTTQEEIVETEEPVEKEERKEEKVEEPEELKEVDKLSVIKKYLDSVQDQIKKDKKITAKMISSWGDYTIDDIEFQREITTKYYEYKVNIIIPNLDAKYPGKKNEKLSTKEYIVLTMYFDIADSERVNGFIVKNIDLIEE